MLLLGVNQMFFFPVVKIYGSWWKKNKFIIYTSIHTFYLYIYIYWQTPPPKKKKTHQKTCPKAFSRIIFQTSSHPTSRYKPNISDKKNWIIEFENLNGTTKTQHQKNHLKHIDWSSQAVVIRTKVKGDESAIDKGNNITHTFALVIRNSYPSVNWKIAKDFCFQ